MELSSASRQDLDAPRPPDDPVPRLIFAVDIEGSTERTNLAKGRLRHFLYELLEQALEAAKIAAKHLEPFTDRGDWLATTRKLPLESKLKVRG